MNPSNSTAARRPVIETRSIDYVPVRERHGTVWHQGPFWFTGNFVVTTMVAGFIGPAIGLSLGWSVLAVVLGAGFGTFFMAFHANQGPRMGLPQMIQSRAQFGTRGAIVPFIAVLFVYVGFNVFNVILATQALQLILPGSAAVWYPVLILVAILLAVVGYDLLHFIQRWQSYLMVAVFLLLTIAALTSLHGGSAIPDAHFDWGKFLIVFGAAAGYQISYAVYVSDYSRYLPPDVSAPAVISWTYAGAALSAMWLMSLGAFIGSAIAEPDAIGSIQQVGNSLFHGFGTFAAVISVPALLSIMAINLYGAMLTGASAVDGFKQLKPSVRGRIIGILVIAIVVYTIALVIPENYLSSFNNFVLMMLYFLIPWTAVNLVDFYFVRRGHYAIADIFKPNGVYGRWSWRGLVAYAVGFAAMIPFITTTFYEGPAAKAIGGGDISFAVGLVVSGVSYWLLTRNLDRSAEEAAMAASERELAALDDAKVAP
ncbi:purine-cytosine permease family protein [Mycobacterium aquaticum]|uniref:Cytosine permease n=1 Tax=Mycobacterium aquaticum TaxID=1927124 RepID=A0A1X0AX92_9MYCO|nr:cytosine permease [Mycobacterium aquaticum]ORA34619.1 cytosine permease [Mycobacterium aquaticum]